MDNFKKSFIAFLLVASTTAFAYYSPLAPQKVNGCYQISNARELHGFAAIVNGSRQFERATRATTMSMASACLRLAPCSKSRAISSTKLPGGRRWIR